MDLAELQSKRVAVAGFGVENKALAHFLVDNGAIITVLDQNPDASIPDEYESILGPHAFDAADTFDVVFRSPGVKPGLFPEATVFSSATQLFLSHFRDQTVAVTGSKGKGTTCTLLHKMLMSAGLDAKLVGNIGESAIGIWGDISSETIIVYEISSFQLIDIDVSPHWAVSLMIVPEHLDWHADMEEYIEAKSHISCNQKTGDISIYFKGHELSKRVAYRGEGDKLAFGDKTTAHIRENSVYYGETKIIDIEAVGLLGHHNLQNVCAALTAFWLIESEKGQTQAEIVPAARGAIASFTGLEHRLELVGKSGDIRFYNDSQATTPLAALAAIDAFPDQKICLIAGGSDKGADIAEFARDLALRPQVKYIQIIGATGPDLARELEQEGFSNFKVYGHGDFSQLLPESMEALSGSGVVLLSPGFASFGLFDNYKQRGTLFKQAAKACASTEQ